MFVKPLRIAKKNNFGNVPMTSRLIKYLNIHMTHTKCLLNIMYVLFLSTKYFAEMGRACSMYRGGEERCIQGFGVKTWGRRTLGRPRRRWEDNIKMDLREVGWGHRLDSSGSGQGQVVDCCECGNEPSSSIKWWKFLE